VLGVKLAVQISGEVEFMELRKSPFSYFLDSMTKDDTLIIGGGGLFKDYFYNFWHNILKFKNIKNFKIILFGLGVCDHKNKKKSTILDESLINEIMEKSELKYIREPFKKYDDNMLYTHCPSMLYIYENYQNFFVKTEKKLLYVSHKDLIGKNKDNEIKKFLKDYCLLNNFSYSEVDNIVRGNMKASDLMKFYINSEIVVTTRLHGYIIARTLGKRVVAISNDNKIEGFAKSIDDVKPLDCCKINKEILSNAIDSSTNFSQEKIEECIKEIKLKGEMIKNFILQAE